MINNINNQHVLAVAMLLTALFGLSMDMIIPVLPNIAISFNINANTTQYILTVFLMGYALLQLIFAPISDHFGRKNTLIMGLAFFIIGSASVTFINSFALLLMFRLMQSLGACASVLSAFSIVRDFFDGRDCTRAVSYVAAAMSFFPVIFVIIGGFLNQYYDWRIVFIFSVVVALIILIYCKVFLIETNDKLGNINIKLVFNNYKAMSQTTSFWIYTITSTTIFVTLLAFLYNVPFIFIKITDNYSALIRVFMVTMSFFLVFGSWSVAHLSRAFSNNKIITIGSLLMVTMGSIMVFIVKLFGLKIWAFFILVYMMCIGLGMINPASQDEIMLPFKHMSGQANALSCCIRFTISSLIANNLHYLNHSINGLAMLLISCGIINIVVIGARHGYLLKQV